MIFLVEMAPAPALGADIIELIRPYAAHPRKTAVESHQLDRHEATIAAAGVVLTPLTAVGKSRFADHHTGGRP
jgi:hypothetical protein